MPQHTIGVTPQYSKKVDLRYRPEQIGQATIDKILRYYQRDVELSAILQRVNGHRAINFCLNLADLYTILNHAAQGKPATKTTHEILPRIKQRKAHLEFELRINEFVTVYKLWRQGLKNGQIFKTIFSNPDGTGRGLGHHTSYSGNRVLYGKDERKGIRRHPEIRKGYSKVAVERLIVSLNRRFREEKASLQIARDTNASDLLAYLKPGLLHGKRVFLLYVDDLPQELLSQGYCYDALKSIELEEDVLIEFDAQQSAQLARLQNDTHAISSIGTAVTEGYPDPSVDYEGYKEQALEDSLVRTPPFFLGKQLPVDSYASPFIKKASEHGGDTGERLSQFTPQAQGDLSKQPEAVSEAASEEAVVEQLANLEKIILESEKEFPVEREASIKDKMASIFD